MTNNQAPLAEQKICVKCGLCCDGTLFPHANLLPGEKGHLPEKIEQNYFRIKDKECFRLPCKYFDGKCTIYTDERANVCRTYRCQLLKDLADNKVTDQDAQEIVRQAVQTRSELIEQYLKLSGSNKNIFFREVLSGLVKMQQSGLHKGEKQKEIEILLARCNIFESLLIKYFKSTSEFEALVSNDDEK